MGAKVIACASTEEKLKKCQENGADYLINISTEDFVEKVKKFTNGKGADVIYDSIGGETFNKSLKCINWGGRIIVIGFANGTIQSIPANILLVKNVDVIGLYWGSYLNKNIKVVQDSFHELFEWVKEDKIKPIVSNVFELKDNLIPIQNFMNRKVIGKYVFTMNSKL
jgi:NADPH:quinone reductase